MVSAQTLLITESINKDGMTSAFHLRTPKAGRGARESPDVQIHDAVNIAQSLVPVTNFLGVYMVRARAASLGAGADA